MLLVQAYSVHMVQLLGSSMSMIDTMLVVSWPCTSLHFAHQSYIKSTADAYRFYVRKLLLGKPLGDRVTSDKD